jgi:hypothetical protein
VCEGTLEDSVRRAFAELFDVEPSDSIRDQFLTDLSEAIVEAFVQDTKQYRSLEEIKEDTYNDLKHDAFIDDSFKRGCNVYYVTFPDEGEGGTPIQCALNRSMKTLAMDKFLMFSTDDA